MQTYSVILTITERKIYEVPVHIDAASPEEAIRQAKGMVYSMEYGDDDLIISKSTQEVEAKINE